MKRQWKIFRMAGLLSLVLALMVAGVALAASTILDHFDVAQSMTVTFTNPGPVTGITSVTDSNALGGERDIFASVSAGGDGTTLDVTVNQSNNSKFVASAQDTVRYTLQIQYDGAGDTTKSDINYTGLGGVDLTQGNTRNRFSLIIPSTDKGGPVTVRVYTDATHCSQRTLTPGAISSLAPRMFDYVFTAFTATCPSIALPANFTNVGAVVVIIDASTFALESQDMSFHFFGATQPNFQDYGDLPSTYEDDPNLVVANARHVESGLSLGASVSYENAKPGTSTIEDTLDNGVVAAGTQWVAGDDGGTLNITVSGCSGTCYVQGFIDWNGDGDFWDTDTGLDFDTRERVLSDYPVVNGANNNILIDLPVDPYDITDVTLYARFRLSQHSISGYGSPWGVYPDGEVEDYLLAFGPTAITLASAKAYPSTPVLVGVLAAVMLVAAGGVMVFRRRRA